MNENFTTEEITRIEEKITTDFNSEKLSIVEDGQLSVSKISDIYTTKKDGIKFTVGDVIGAANGTNIMFARTIVKVENESLIFRSMILEEGYYTQNTNDVLKQVKNETEMPIFMLEDPFNLREK